MRNYHLRKERWYGVKGYEGLYQYSNFGNVKTVERIVQFGKQKRIVKERILNQCTNRGYKQVILSKNGVEKTLKVHRIVAEGLIPNPDNKPEVDHKDTHRDNNCVWNLRWVTKKENSNNPISKQHNSERQKGEKSVLYSKTGKQHHSSKPVLQFDLDGNFIKEWECAMQVQREIGIKFGNVCDCCRHYPHRNTAGGYKWEFKNNN